jgi:hypothetical protein
MSVQSQIGKLLGKYLQFVATLSIALLFSNLVFLIDFSREYLIDISKVI